MLGIELHSPEGLLVNQGIASREVWDCGSVELSIWNEKDKSHEFRDLSSNGGENCEPIKKWRDHEELPPRRRRRRTPESIGKQLPYNMGSTKERERKQEEDEIAFPISLVDPLKASYHTHSGRSIGRCGPCRILLLYQFGRSIEWKEQKIFYD